MLINLILILFLSVSCTVNKASNELSILFHKGFSLENFDISRITVSDESSFVRSTFSTLVRYGENGQVVGDLAETFWWEGERLHFKIRDEAQTSNGNPITSNDVALTLIRSLEKNHSTHGSLWQFFDVGSIESIKEKLKIHSKKEISISTDRNAKLLLQTLSVPEMSIISFPADHGLTVTHNDALDFSNTTGVYYVKSTHKSYIELWINKNHHLYSSKMAEVVKLVHIDQAKTSLLDALDEGIVDVKPTFYFHNVREILNHYGEDSKFNIHETFNIQLILLNFSDKKEMTLSIKRRKIISKIIKDDSLSRNSGNTEVLPAYQFFSIYGEGLLSDQEKTSLINEYKLIETKGESGEGVRLQAPNEYVAQHYRDRYRTILPKMKIQVITNKEISRLKDEGKFGDIPDLYFSATDTGFSDNISLINYAVKSNVFSRQILDKDKWLTAYYKLSKEKQLDEIKKIHFEMLQSFLTVPLVSTPYIAIARKPWGFVMPRFHASTPFWMIQNVEKN